MSKQVRNLLLFLTLLLAPVFCYAQPAMGKVSFTDTNKVRIVIRPIYNGKPLKTGNQYYVNALGDTFNIDVFRFYISNMSFTDGTTTISSNSHLFDVDDTGTYTYTISIPPGTYSSLQFVVGVDSIANTSGANEGDLDPVKGMYWAWNSGYIMAKLEGHSKACKTLHQAFEFHIGGYMPPYNTARKVVLNIPELIDIGKHYLPVIPLNADVAAWLNDIDLSQVNSVLIPGKEAMTMADKYAKMFSIENIFYTPPAPR
jgi:hypothetical protein